MQDHRLIGLVLILALGLASAGGCKTLDRTKEARLRYDEGARLYGSKKYEEAIDSFGEAVRLNPRYAQAFYKRGNCQYRLGKFEEAVKDYRRALEEDAHFKDALWNKGNVLAWELKTGYHEALLAFLKILTLEPRHQKANRQVGFLLHFHFSKEKKAILYYRRYLNYGGKDARVKIWLRTLESRYPDYKNKHKPIKTRTKTKPIKTKTKTKPIKTKTKTKPIKTTGPSKRMAKTMKN